ncbi:nuclear receptor co-repressor 1 [Culex quinquefasciatus]|uniref:Nuclear receptor co-repressor 1 n=1 Tax=Culex quinquefasciatus TaxID=7176 RepID=B0W642_CULQU|nr:nuclear receptor co-repressor 1 [Culex quinquefasciatus]|eukprot:XP_001844176.1 nuclear receptor co-repressor 1 [Culex quinquefasciatus]
MYGSQPPPKGGVGVLFCVICDPLDLSSVLLNVVPHRVLLATTRQLSVDASQSYSRGGPSPSQSAPRSAASPLSPPRPGPGAGAANYPPFAGAPAREAPLRYGPNNSYYRDNPYTRVSQVPQVSEYHRSVPVVSVSSSIPAPISIANSMEPVQQQQPTRHRMSLLPHTPDYLQGRSAQQSQSAQSDSGPPAFKKIRLNDTSQPAQSPLNVDTRDPPVSSGAYHPQVEAISPTLPSDPTEELRATKDDLLQQIAKVDMEIDKAEKKIAMLKKKQESLEEASLKPAVEESAAEAQPKHRSLAQQIYAENRKRASTAHAVLSALGTATDLPLYNQPSDAETCRDIQDRHKTFRQHLLAHFKKIKSERAAKQVELTERYAQMSQDWSKRVDKMEASAKRKAKEAKNREFFEKVFPELRKQREDKERFNRVGSRIKSEADLEEIMDGLQEQAMEDKKMRSYAVIPPLMLDSRQRRLVFNNENGALIDMETEFKERLNLNVWTVGEKEVFREKFLQHPKNFGMIAASLDRKCAQDCVRYYYLSKKAENYKQLLRKSRQRTRSSRNIQKTNQNQTQCIVDALTTGVTTRLQREQQQKTVGRDRAANSTNSSIGNSSASNVTTNSSSNITNNNNGSSSSSSANSISVSNNSPQQAKHDQPQPSATSGSTTVTTASVATAAPVTSSTVTTSTASPPSSLSTVSSSSASTTVTTTSAAGSTPSSTSATSIGNSTSSNSSSTISSSNGTTSTSESSSSATSVVPGSAESAKEAIDSKDETSKDKQAAGSDATVTSQPGLVAPVTENSTTVPTITTTSTTATVSTAASTAPGTTNASLSRSATPSSAAVPTPPSITSSSSSSLSSSVSSSPSISSSGIAPTSTISSSVAASPLSVSSTIISSSSSSTLATSVSNTASSISVTSNSSSNSTSIANNIGGHSLSSVTAVETSFVPNSSSSSISTIPLNGVKTDVLNSTTVTATTVAVTTPLNNNNNSYGGVGINVNNVNSTMPNLTHGSVPVTLTAAAVPGGPTSMPPSSQPPSHLPSLQQQQQQQLFNNTTSTPKNASSAASSMEIIIKDFTLETLVSNVVKKKFGVKDNNLLKDELEPSDPKKMRLDLDGIKDGSINQDGKGGYARCPEPRARFWATCIPA